MNIRRQLYKKNRLAGMSQYNSARSAGYSHHTSTKACRIEQGVKGSIQDALEQAGITEKYQSAELYKLTNASRVISCNIFVDKNGEMKKADGKSLDFIEVDDPAIQLRTWEHISKLKNQLKDAPLIEQHTHYHVKITRNARNRISSRVRPSRQTSRRGGVSESLSSLGSG